MTQPKSGRFLTSFCAGGSISYANEVRTAATPSWGVAAVCRLLHGDADGGTGYCCRSRGAGDCDGVAARRGAGVAAATTTSSTAAATTTARDCAAREDEEKREGTEHCAPTTATRRDAEEH